MLEKTLAELSRGLDKGEFSSVELTQFYLDRIKKYDPILNSFITVTPELALQQAKAADSARQAGAKHPLLGIPMAQKDIFCTDGVKTSCGSLMLDNFIAPYNATVVDKLHTAGMVMLGKLNMDEFAMGSSNETSHYGPVRNPWDPDYVPGGSSGGSAAAVAARLAPMATGTDTGGSIRQPAALCGVTGIKPTYGRVSRYGMIAFASSLDQAGPLTQSAEDAAMVLEAMSGFCDKDSTSVDVPVSDLVAQLGQSIKGKTIGLPKEYFSEGLSPEVAAAIDETIKVLKGLGVNFKEISLPNSPLSVPVYYIVASAECSSNLSRFDGVRFGYRCKDPKDLIDMYMRSRSEGFGTEVKRRLMIGTFALCAGEYDAYYVKAQQVRHLISEDFKKAFESVDLILGPTTPTTAFKIGAKVDSPVQMYLNDIYTIATNLAGLPGLSMPCGFANGLPMGCQLVGPYLQEGLLLNVAHQYQQITDWHRRTPAQFK